MTAQAAVEDLVVDTEILENVAALLDLREPNREAVETLAAELARHVDLEHRTDPFEGVIDSATGVGKTFIFAGSMEYLARARGIRNFALIAPSRVILTKTIEQFTLGHDKSIISDLGMPLTVITSDNFNSPSVAAAIDDENRIKVYVFTVQALLQPKSQGDRRTHTFQEGLGSGLYQRLQDLDDLVIFADEHHSYFGPQFNAAIHDLHPHAIVGLTATPAPKTPDEQIIYRYPLAAAIADQFVKTPVIVGRRDDNKDPRTKLLDGVGLLEIKRDIAEKYAERNGKRRINPVMLVVARDIDEAEAWADIVRAEDFMGGSYRDAVLLVHSRAVREANEAQELRRLQDVEHPDSPIRVIISVQMLKEGWDVKNVYVLLSTQPSLSDILTEQVLGRGLRLPWGTYTGNQMLDTLEVIAHDRFDDLLRRKGVLSEDFVNYKTRAVIRQNSYGEPVVVRETVEVTPHLETPTAETVTVVVPTQPTAASGPDEAGADTSGQAQVSTNATVSGGIGIVDLGSRAATASAEQSRMATEIAPSKVLEVPVAKQSIAQSRFSLADITDTTPFRLLGEQLHVDPENTLRRTVVSARVVTDDNGIKHTELVTSDAVDAVRASGLTLSIDDLRNLLTDAILGCPVVTATRDEGSVQRKAVKPLLDAFFSGLNGDADQTLSAYLERATARLLALVTAEARRYAQPPKIEHSVELKRVTAIRSNTRPLTENRHGQFQRGAAYTGWARSVYQVEWFHSSPERDLANILDEAAGIETWLRLQVGELPILWADGQRKYNADFVVVEADGSKWIVEVKADKDITNDEVLAKREAAKRWVNYVNASDKTNGEWRYLLLAERDIKQATGSWAALKGLGTV